MPRNLPTASKESLLSHRSGLPATGFAGDGVAEGGRCCAARFSVQVAPPVAEAVAQRRAVPLGSGASRCTCAARRRAAGVLAGRPAARQRCRPRLRAGPVAPSLDGSMDIILVAFDSKPTEGAHAPNSLLERVGPSATTSPVRSKGGLFFSVFSALRPGTRLVSVQGQEFYAFTSPRQGTSQVVIWRRLGDCVAAGYGPLLPGCPSRVTLLGPDDSPSPGRRGTKMEGPLVDLYARRAYDRSAWIYWESFWVPVGTSLPMVMAARLAAFEPQLRAPGDTSKAPRHLATTSPDAAPTEEKATAFAQIYHRGVWPGLLSRSGPGSDPFHPMVRVALTALDAVVDALGVRSVIDAACGDARWIVEHFLARRPEVAYTGVDIVAHVIEENRQRYPRLDFLCADLGSGDGALPSADLVFSKETFNHMFVQDAACAVNRLAKAGSKYLLVNIVRSACNLIGASKGHHANYAQYDYSLPPFNLRKIAPVVEINREDWSEFAIYELS